MDGQIDVWTHTEMETLIWGDFPHYVPLGLHVLPTNILLYTRKALMGWRNLSQQKKKFLQPEHWV